jgi:hypothetical protein
LRFACDYARLLFGRKLLFHDEEEEFQLRSPKACEHSVRSLQ